MDTCVKCKTSLEMEEQRCTCDDSVCLKCCKCGSGCDCECEEKAAALLEV